MSAHNDEFESQKILFNAILDLEYSFMSMADYINAVQSGTIKQYKYLTDDITFQNENPGHPMAARYRLQRIKAADSIRNLARIERNIFDVEVLRELHRSLFDCCAAVRLSILDSLFYLSYDESLDYIKRLVIQESESPMVRERAELFAELLESSVVSPKHIVAVTENIDLLKELLNFASLRSSEVRWAKPYTPDIIAFPAAALVVEPAFVGKKAWDGYIEYLEEVGDDYDTPLVILGEGYALKSPRKRTLCTSPLHRDRILNFINDYWDDVSDS